MGDSRARRLAVAGCTSLLASAGGFVYLGVRHLDWMDWRSVAFGGGLAAAAVGLTRKNVITQVLSRAMAWIVFAPMALVTVVEASRGRFDGGIAAFAATSGLALLLSRPMLSTDDAKAAFAPSKFRRAFLSASTASMTVGLITGIVAFELLAMGTWAGGLALGALGTAMLGAAIGVLRMRGWGIALGLLTSIASLITGMLMGSGQGFALACGAVPGILLLLPILFAKLGLGEDSSPAAARTRVSLDAEALPSRVRIATGEEEEDVLDDLTERSASSASAA